MSQNPATNPNTIPQFNYGTLTALPVAEQNQTYLAYCDGVGGTGPEVIDQTAYFIKYLINTQGEVANPAPENIALLNLLDNFESGKNAKLIKLSDDPSNPPSINADYSQGIHPITYVGRIAPILVTETGSGKMDYIATMSFVPPNPPGDPVANISTLTRVSASVSMSFNSWQTVNFSNEVYGDGWTFGGTYSQLNTSSAAAGTRIKLKASLAIATPYLYTPNFAIRIRIERGSPGGTVIADSGFIPIEVAPISAPKAYALETGYIDSDIGNPAGRYYVRYDFNINSNNPTEVALVGTDDNNPDTYFLVQQENAPYDPFAGPELNDGENAIYKSTAGLFSNGYNYVQDFPNVNYSYIFWNSGSAQMFNSGKIQTLDPESAKMGFSPITIPFGDTKRGDYIRLEYNKNQVYNIVDVTPIYAGSYPILRMKVTPNIGTLSGVNTSITSSHFCIYRIVNDGTYVVLDVKKDEVGSFTSILVPEFISQELKGNYDKIVTDLTQKNVIS